MKTLWDSIFSLDIHRTLWIEQEALGAEISIKAKDKQGTVRMPHKVNTVTVMRLKGLGRTRQERTGDLYLHIHLNKGEDVRKDLWLSEQSAREGTEKRLLVAEQRITVVVPSRSYDGLIVRLKDLGKEPDFNWRVPFLRRRRGNALVKLRVYPDTVTPRYGTFDMLSTESMELEGWVYRKYDEVKRKLGPGSFAIPPLTAEAVADCFNTQGWRGIFGLLLRHFGLAHLPINAIQSESLNKPGVCLRNIQQQGPALVSNSYTITIHTQFTDHPFAAAAILAHELCHIVHMERISGEARMSGTPLRSEREELEVERTVDLLVFMYGVGEFQLRVSRDQRLTIGYFNQEVFERMQVIVSRKLTQLSSPT